MKKNEMYVSPECEAVELRLEGVIATSPVYGSALPDWGDEEL